MRKIEICMFSCWYEKVSLAGYTSGLISPLRDGRDLEIRLIAAHCDCLERFPKRRASLRGECQFVNWPYFKVPSTGIKSLNNALNLIQRFIDVLRGFLFLLECKNCDVIHYQQSSSYSFGFSTLIPIVLLSSKKKVITMHSTDPILGDFKILFRLYKRVDKIIVHSESMRTHLIKNGVLKSKIVKIYHGVNIPPLFGLKRSEITFFGSPEERKGILTVLDALKLLKSRNINIQVSIYGFYTDSEKKRTELQAASRGVNDCLIWGGKLTEIDFDKKLQQSLFTLADYSGPTSGSNLLTRAMSNATPVISSDIGGLKEYLDGGGILLEPKNPEALAEAIELLLKNAEMREKLGKSGRERALNFLSWEKISEKTVAVYGNVLGKTSS